MSMRPLVSNILVSTAMKLGTLVNNIHILQINHTEKERHWPPLPPGNVPGTHFH